MSKQEFYDTVKLKIRSMQRDISQIRIDVSSIRQDLAKNRKLWIGSWWKFTGKIMDLVSRR